MKTETKSTDIREKILDTAQTIMSGKGFSAVGLNEILAAASVPKGSFYHYFQSKETFGEAMLQRYFDRYLKSMDELFSQPGVSGAKRLMLYWQNWLDSQTTCDPQSKCLVVKLAAEVADLSEAMRTVLLHGTGKITARLAGIIGEGIRDGSLAINEDPAQLALALYQLWLGASVMAKITRDDTPLRAAMETTVTKLTPGSV
ncbi:TetR/AcrR family transcriptional regulator [Thalassospira marina]|uniref:TetR family transcriptional regulator n=1 Tax=Thalassospira marina TaxID=2048283 RepID=A0ABN5FH54_9PROT|nr:TetR/AcrR family transcriptional regulator [Thalassospira marina]AUG53520.1 TetR family transcriptional regulator [Thalassospira marina]